MGNINICDKENDKDAKIKEHNLFREQKNEKYNSFSQWNLPLKQNQRYSI